ncbi:MAG: Hsp20/alpha crystallin family protein [Anaerolineaceae bacterium]|nr:Hsp20/alpha crystallin family protein [Anaerolineaceae bacterium]
MTLYVNPNALMEARRRMMRRMVADSFDNGRVMTFPVELSQTDEEYTLRAMLPGMSAEEVNIELNSNVLTIEGEYKVAENREEPLVDEFPSGRFARSFELSDAVLAEKIEASMSSGILSVRIPKAEEAKPRTIKVVAK